MNNKLQKYALLAEIIGGVAIVTSLLFVGFQVRQNSISVQAQTRLALTEQARDNIKVAMNDISIDIYVKLANGEELSQREYFVLDRNINLMFRGAENVFYQHRIGTLTEDEFSGVKVFYKRELSDPYVRERWASVKPMFSTEFQKEMDSLITELDN